MPPKENKTADKKAYQAEYRKNHPKSKEEQNKYMKKYIFLHANYIIMHYIKITEMYLFVLT
jgi:hypothetical protein